MISCKFCNKPIPITSIKYDSRRLDRRISRPSGRHRRIKPYGYTCSSCQQEFRVAIENNPELKATHDRIVKAIKEGEIPRQLREIEAMQRELREKLKAQRLKKKWL